jgi:hypothetical protein
MPDPTRTRKYYFDTHQTRTTLCIDLQTDGATVIHGHHYIEANIASPAI